MVLSIDEVAHVAMLARLGLSDTEMAQMTEQLSAVLEHINMLNALDTSDVPPTTGGGAENTLRPDVALPSLPLEQVLANAPQREGDYIKVGTVLDAIGE